MRWNFCASGGMFRAQKQLGQRRLAGKTIPQQNDLSLPGGQAVQQLPHPAEIVLRFAGVLHAEAVLQHIGQRQRRVTI